MCLREREKTCEWQASVRAAHVFERERENPRGPVERACGREAMQPSGLTNPGHVSRMCVHVSECNVSSPTHLPFLNGDRHQCCSSALGAAVDPRGHEQETFGPRPRPLISREAHPQHSVLSGSRGARWHGGPAKFALSR
jgi:hypothetical protein